MDFQNVGRQINSIIPLESNSLFVLPTYISTDSLGNKKKKRMTFENSIPNVYGSNTRIFRVYYLNLNVINSKRQVPLVIFRTNFKVLQPCIYFDLFFRLYFKITVTFDYAFFTDRQYTYWFTFYADYTQLNFETWARFTRTCRIQVANIRGEIYIDFFIASLIWGGFSIVCLGLAKTIMYRIKTRIIV